MQLNAVQMRLIAQLRRCTTCRYEILPPDEIPGRGAHDPSANTIADSLRIAIAANASSLCVAPARLPARAVVLAASGEPPLDKDKTRWKGGIAVAVRAGASSSC